MYVASLHVGVSLRSVEVDVAALAANQVNSENQDRHVHRLVQSTFLVLPTPPPPHANENN
jgi:hypothetical protein